LSKRKRKKTRINFERKRSDNNHNGETAKGGTEISLRDKLQPVHFDLKDKIIGLSIFVSCLTVYIFTLAPTIFFGDSGEFVTAAYNLGIVHPPGYPLYTLIGKLFTLVVPSGILRIE
jgi:hypothetical protein